MTDHTNAELIATAKAMREQLGDDYPKPGSILALWLATATALEAAEQDRNQLAAVVEKVRVFIERQSGWFRYRAEPVSTVLASAGADVLREHDAKVRAKAVRDARDELGVYVGDEDSDWWDGYRNGQRRQNTALGEYADRIEREAGLK